MVFSECWGQYKVPRSLYVLMILVRSSYSGLALRGYADYQTCIWTITLTANVFMAGRYSLLTPGPEHVQVVTSLILGSNK